MRAFFSDFWEVVVAAYELPADADDDRYWATLIHWADVLMNKHGGGNNPVVNRLVMAFLDAQSIRQYPPDSGITSQKN